MYELGQSMKSDLSTAGVVAAMSASGGVVPSRELLRDLATRTRRHRSCWLIDGRNRSFVAPLDALFQVYHQREVGAPWCRVLRPDGPLWLPVTTTREQFFAVAASSGFRPGQYQLTPVTPMGEFCGDPPRPVEFHHCEVP